MILKIISSFSVSKFSTAFPNCILELGPNCFSPYAHLLDIELVHHSHGLKDCQFDNNKVLFWSQIRYKLHQ